MRVIIKAVPRNDLDERQRFIAEHTGRELASRDILLDEHLILIAEGVQQRFVKLRLRMRNRDADGGAAAAWLYDAGQLDLRYRFAPAQQHAIRHRHARTAKQLLCDPLVHGDRAAERRAARIADAEQIEQRLQLAVLTVAAVQRQKRDVRGAAKLNHTVPDGIREPVRAAPLHRIEVRRGLLNRVRDVAGHAGERIERVLRQVGPAEKQVDQTDTVTAALQRGGDLCAGGEGDVAFGGKPAR